MAIGPTGGNPRYDKQRARVGTWKMISIQLWLEYMQAVGPISYAKFNRDVARGIIDKLDEPMPGL